MSLSTLVPYESAPERREPPPSMIERMTLILDVFPSRSAQLSLEQVARRTHLPRSTAHRILDQLVRLDWVEHRAAGYCLGQRARALGGRDQGYGEIRAAAAPVLHELQVRTGLVVHLAALEGAEVHYLDKIGGRFAASVPSRVGGRAPAHCTALGKAMLACLPPETVDERLGRGLGRPTPRTIGDLDRLHQELNRIRSRRGLAFEQAECFDEISCVAAALPLAGDDRLTAISLVGDARAPLEKVAPLVVDAVRRVRAALVPHEGEPRRSMRVVPAPTPSPDTAAWYPAVAHGDWL